MKLQCANCHSVILAQLLPEFLESEFAYSTPNGCVKFNGKVKDFLEHLGIFGLKDRGYFLCRACVGDKWFGPSTTEGGEKK